MISVHKIKIVLSLGLLVHLNALSQNSFQSKLDLAEKKFNEGKYNNALKSLDEIIGGVEKGTEKAFFQGLIGHAYLIRAKCKIKLNKDACKDIELALKEEPQETFLTAKESCPSLITPAMEALYYTIVAMRLSWNGHDQQAKPYLIKVIELSPNDDSFSEHRAIAYINLGERQKALLEYDKFVQRTHTSFAYSTRGDLLFKLGKFEEALADFNVAVDSFPSNSIYLRERGATLFILKRYEEAITDFNRALEDRYGNPSDPYVFLQRAKCYIALGDLERACKDLNSIEEADRSEEILALLKDCKD
jgi:tetratricopeptide (TPR) repeat protein